MEIITLRDEYIKLGQALKACGLVESGVDAKIDDFLNKHFLQYNDYCAYKKPHPEFAEYLYYTEVFEDDQYDD